MSDAVEKIRQRFQGRYERLDAEQCWPWLGTRFKKDGRGLFYVNSEIGGQVATRVQWWLTHGRWPEPHLFMCHHCDNPPCVNPAHLYEGTRKDNARDSIQRGTFRFDNITHYAKGEKHLNAKLTEEKVRGIIRDRNRGTSIKKLAKGYGISTGTICDIIAVRTWAHVPRNLQ